MCVGVILALLGAINQSAILFIAGVLVAGSAYVLSRAVSKDFKKGKHAYAVEQYPEAIRWYRKAAGLGNMEAEMTATDISEAQRRARTCLESNAEIWWEKQRRPRIFD